MKHSIGKPEKKLNLGSGNQILAGYVNLDIEPGRGADVVHNLEKFPYPFKDEEFDFILMSHVIEHLSDTIGVMSEIYRILKPGGVVVIKFPYYLHPNAWLDPTHKKCLTEETFRYFTVDMDKNARVLGGRIMHNPVKKDKLFTKMEYRYIPTWLGYSVYPLIKVLRHFCTILILEVEVRLTK